MKQTWKKKLAASAAVGVLTLAMAPVAAFGAGALTAGEYADRDPDIQPETAADR